MNWKRLSAALAVVLAAACATVGEEVERGAVDVVAGLEAAAEQREAELLGAIRAAAELASQGLTPDSVAAVMESCASRCKHECQGLNVASCFLNCSNHNCHPSCCGCKDGSAGCDGCGASCGHNDESCGDVLSVTETSLGGLGVDKHGQ